MQCRWAGVLIFASVVIAALKMIANANNPQKRAESIGALAWICGGGVTLGASLIIAGIIVNIATNNTNISTGIPNTPITRASTTNCTPNIRANARSS